MEILSNNKSGQAILNFNPGFFGGASQLAQKQVPLKDPFSDILERQHQWQNLNKIGGSVAGVDLVNYTEMHHPMSHHNVACGKDNPNVFPTDLEKARKEAVLVQKGFYSRETFELKNGYVS